MKKQPNKKGRGKPQEWTDDQLKEMALEVKYKNQNKSLTPSLLEKETGVGRNTWSRRMKIFIGELNKPILPNISLDDKSEVTLPSVDLIFKKYGKEQQALKNELINLEILIYDLYSELKQYKTMEDKYQKAINEAESLKEKVSQHKKRADHYEQLYNSITISSSFPHLQTDKRSQLFNLGIKDNLINFDRNKEKNSDLENLSLFFPDISNESISTNEESEKDKKRESIMKELLNKFDI